MGCQTIKWQAWNLKIVRWGRPKQMKINMNKSEAKPQGRLIDRGEEPPAPQLMFGAWFHRLGQDCICILWSHKKSQGHSGQVVTQFSTVWSLIWHSTDGDWQLCDNSLLAKCNLYGGRWVLLKKQNLKIWAKFEVANQAKYGPEKGRCAQSRGGYWSQDKGCLPSAFSPHPSPIF